METSKDRWKDSGPAPLKRWDILLGLVFVLLGMFCGGMVIWSSDFADIYMVFMPELVYHACGYGWVRPPETPKLVIDFLFSRGGVSFDCASLARPDIALPRGIFVETQLYLAMLASFAWRISSLEYRNLWPIAALLSGAYASGCFALLRAFFSRWLAVTGATLLLLSPIAIGMIVSLRDYSKAPFFIWSFVLLLVAVRAVSARASVGWASLAGAVIGAGYGFRSDCIIMLPIGLLLLLFVRPLTGWLSRGVATLGFVGATLLVASPMLTLGNSGGFGHLVMQGLSEPYQNYLSLGPAPYSFGSRYSDELTLSMIAADLSATDPTWAQREPQPGEGMTQAVARSGPYALKWLPYFSGDLATQSLKSALWILGMPALVSPERQQQNWKIPGPGRPFAKYFGYYDSIGLSWLPLISLAGLFVFFWQTRIFRPRETLALTLVFGAMLVYTVVQFAIRHVFHLEFLWVLAVLAILRTPFHLAAMRSRIRSYFPAAAIFILLIFGIRLALIVYQDAALGKQFQALLDLPREDVQVRRVSVPDDNVLVQVPVPDRYDALVNGPADSMDNTMGQRGTQWQVIASADRLLVSIEGAACAAGKLSLLARYQKRPTVWQPQDFQIEIDVNSGTSTKILLPALYRATQYFNGLEVPRAYANCISKIQRIKGPTDLPVILTAIFSADWQTVPLHRDFGNLRLGYSPRDTAFKVYDTAEH